MSINLTHTSPQICENQEGSTENLHHVHVNQMPLVDVTGELFSVTPFPKSSFLLCIKLIKVIKVIIGPVCLCTLNHVL